MITTTNLGYPRIGRRRELKRAVEAYWQGKINQAELLKRTQQLELDRIAAQAARGIQLVPCNDFSLYDHVLDHSAMFGVVPERFGQQGGPLDLDTYFAVARGRDDAVASPMTKWFNTNYHYIVPEFERGFELVDNYPLSAWRRANQALGINTKPVLLGPFTYLRLGHDLAQRGIETLMAQLVPLYRTVLEQLADAGVEWVQMDEPALVTDVSDHDMALVRAAYERLAGGLSVRLMLQTYFDHIAHRWDEVMELPVDGVGLDLASDNPNLDSLERLGLPREKVLGIGIVNGRSVWRTDLDAAWRRLERIARHVDVHSAHLAPSSSLLHLPITTDLEADLGSELLSWLAFADQRLDEVVLLARGQRAGRHAISAQLAASQRLMQQRRRSELTTDPQVRQRVASLRPDDFERRGDPATRRRQQQSWLQLPPLPTTTIGSFPQTDELRRMRLLAHTGQISALQYQRYLYEQYEHIIRTQEQIGLDILVHGEPERSDMVDYFAQQLRGMAFIQGWVQSYGTRCVRPPLIYGDVSRPQPMTVETARYVASLTDRPVKGMLTGPMTMLLWSFVRDDLAWADVALQLALAIRDETLDLEDAGVGIIQIDEPALREGLPLKRAGWSDYLDAATRAFRLASSGVRSDTQIQSHMCYSDFWDTMEAIDQLQADVLLIESARAGPQLLEAFRHHRYERAVGPGVYDVHSARVPSVEEMRDLIVRAARAIPPQLLWVNPDCGLKTRRYEEVIPALTNMVQAAKLARQHFAAELMPVEPQADSADPADLPSSHRHATTPEPPVTS
jgi:5-methyltetrahydropteroyltriglutamate--homocysteine methyltransferase